MGRGKKGHTQTPQTKPSPAETPIIQRPHTTTNPAQEQAGGPRTRQSRSKALDIQADLRPLGAGSGPSNKTVESAKSINNGAPATKISNIRKVTTTRSSSAPSKPKASGTSRAPANTVASAKIIAPHSTVAPVKTAAPVKHAAHVKPTKQMAVKAPSKGAALDIDTFNKNPNQLEAISSPPIGQHGRKKGHAKYVEVSEDDKDSPKDNPKGAHHANDVGMDSSSDDDSEEEVHGRGQYAKNRDDASFEDSGSSINLTEHEGNEAELEGLAFDGQFNHNDEDTDNDAEHGQPSSPIAARAESKKKRKRDETEDVLDNFHKNKKKAALSQKKLASTAEQLRKGDSGQSQHLRSTKKRREDQPQPSKKGNPPTKENPSKKANEEPEPKGKGRDRSWLMGEQTPSSRDINSVAKQDYRAWILTHNAFPTPDQHVQRCERVFQKAGEKNPRAFKKCGTKGSAHSREVMYANEATSIKGQIKQSGATMIESAYSLFASDALGQTSTSAARVTAVKERVAELLENDAFIYGPFEGVGRVAFANPAIGLLVRKGVIALACCVLRHCLEEYTEGYRQPAALSQNIQRSIYRTYLAKLERFKADPNNKYRYRRMMVAYYTDCVNKAEAPAEDENQYIEMVENFDLGDAVEDAASCAGYESREDDSD